MKAIKDAYGWLRGFVMQPAVAVALIGINAVAGVVGTIYWYGPELPKTPWWALVFVPDCPLFSALFAVALIGLLWGKRWTLFNTITAVGLVKYGIWTVTVWSIYWSVGNPVTIESAIMTTTHIGMILQGIVLFSFLHGPSWHHVLIAGFWFFLSDWVDYGLGFRPRMAPGVPEVAMMWEMIVVSAVLTATLGWMVWRRRAKLLVERGKSVIA